jgi:Tfp pilus tip-associated adhesin PilY1
MRQWQGGEYISSLPIGNYILKSTASDFEPYTRKFTIRENQLTEINAHMVSITEAESEKTYTAHTVKDDKDGTFKKSVKKSRKKGLKQVILYPQHPLLH